MDDDPGPKPESVRLPDSEHRQQETVQADPPGDRESNRDDPGWKPKGLGFPLATSILASVGSLGYWSQTPSRSWWSRVDYRSATGRVFRRG